MLRESSTGINPRDRASPSILDLRLHDTFVRAERDPSIECDLPAEPLLVLFESLQQARVNIVVAGLDSDLRNEHGRGRDLRA